jgi:hypothetical protein
MTTHAARDLAGRMLIEPSAADIDALVAHEIACLSTGSPVQQSIGRLWAKGFRTAWIEWRMSERERACDPLPSIFASCIVELYCGTKFSDEEVRRRCAAVLTDTEALVNASLDIALEARRIRFRGDG